jgi:hypothetical protein
MPLDLRVGGALVLLFEMLVSRITQLTKDDVIEDGQATYLAIDGHRLMLPPRLADLIRQLRDQDEPRWTLGRLGTSAPWLFPGQSPARPAVDIPFGVRLHRYGIDAHAGRNTARLALAGELPASVLADLTGISISTAERWSQWAKRHWAIYVAERSVSSRNTAGQSTGDLHPAGLPPVVACGYERRTGPDGRSGRTSPRDSSAGKRTRFEYRIGTVGQDVR